MTLSRRHFLWSAAAASLGLAGLQRLFLDERAAAVSGAEIADGFGPLLRDPRGLLDLPEGFGYTVFSAAGEEMDDGFLVPTMHDGMAAFPGPGGRTVLVRNHEVDPGEGPEAGPFGEDWHRLGRLDPKLIYDPARGREPCQGGTVTLLYDTRSQALAGHRLSLTGTLRNCAGGPTPWNTWISCEEHVQRADGYYERDHGYNFEVPASLDDPLPIHPEPLTAMGRFEHEAVCVHPASGIVYQTEDRHDSLIYRFLPNRPGELARGGRLQALALRGHPGLDARNWRRRELEPGDALETEWIEIDRVEAPDDDLRLRGHERGATLFARGEGMWMGDGVVYFACTNGGRARKGQIWRYTPGPREGTGDESREPGRLELFIEADDGTLLENADNLTVAPWGDLVVCEDGSGEDFLVGVTPEGEIYRFARNRRSSGELAGACFSPDGSTLFLNMQREGLTVAITGPWESRGRRAG